MSKVVYDFAAGQERIVDEPVETELVIRCAADIEPENIDFLWAGRLARGKHTAFAGDPGDGKSQLSLNIAAKITTGGAWPCGEGQAPIGNVIILSAEDGPADTIVPRLIAAGADLSKVHIVSAVADEDGKSRSFNLQADLAQLEATISKIGEVALIIIDPISSYMGKSDSHKNAEVRSVLEPLSEMAERHGVAVLSVTHFSKAGTGNGNKALYRFIGSIAFTGAPRAAFAVVADPDDEGRRLLLATKNNMAPKPQGLAYRIEQTVLKEPHLAIVTSRVVWDAELVTMTADDAMATDCGDSTARADAEDFLRQVLSDGPMDAKSVKSEADAAGIAWATVRRAKERIGVTSERETFGNQGGGRWLWVLPESVRCSHGSQDAHVKNMSTLRENEHLTAKSMGYEAHHPPQDAQESVRCSSLEVSTLRENEPLTDAEKPVSDAEDCQATVDEYIAILLDKGVPLDEAKRRARDELRFHGSS